MLDEARLEQEIAAGVNVICATCQHHWEGKARGQGSCGDTSCLGPAKAGIFPNYKGSILREKFPYFCLRCLNPRITFQVIVDGTPAFGLCQKHWRTFEFLKTGDALQSIAPLLIPV